MTDLRLAAAFAAGLHRDRAAVAWAGYLRRDRRFGVRPEEEGRAAAGQEPFDLHHRPARHP